MPTPQQHNYEDYHPRHKKILFGEDAEQETTILDFIKKSSDFGEIQPQKYLWDGWLPDKGLTILAGDGGLGKTWVLSDILGRASNGKSFPVQETESRSDGLKTDALLHKKCFFFNFEDSIDNLRGRLKKMGYHSENIQFFDWANNDAPVDLRNKDFINVLDAVFEIFKDGVIVIDPINEMMHSLNDHDESDVRMALKHLHNRAEKYNVSVVAVKHFRKPEQGRRGFNVNDILGSVAWKNKPRQILVMELTDPNDPDSTRRIYSGKKNLEGVAKYTLEFDVPEDSVLSYDFGILPSSDPTIGNDVSEAILSTLRRKNELSLNIIEDELRELGFSQTAIRKGKKICRATGQVTVKKTSMGDYWKLVVREKKDEQESTSGDVDPAQQDTTNPTQQEVEDSLFGNESDAEKDFKRLVKDPLEEMLNKLNGEGETN